MRTPRVRLNCRVGLELPKSVPAYHTCTLKSRLSSRSYQSVLRVLHLYLKVTTSTTELFEVGLAYCTLRLSSSRCQSALSFPHLYLEVATFEPEVRNTAKRQGVNIDNPEKGREGSKSLSPLVHSPKLVLNFHRDFMRATHGSQQADWAAAAEVAAPWHSEAPNLQNLIFVHLASEHNHSCKNLLLVITGSLLAFWSDLTSA